MLYFYFRTHIRKTAHLHRKPQQLEIYDKRLIKDESIVNIAKSIHFSPCLLLKSILELHYNWSKPDINKYLKDPTLLSDKKWKPHFEAAIENDFYYSPAAEMARQ